VKKKIKSEVFSDTEYDEESESDVRLSRFTQQAKFSNALNLVHTIPRFDRRKQNYRLQHESGSAVRTYVTQYLDSEYTVKVTAASVLRKNSTSKVMENVLIWPGDREEKVEAGILKLAAGGGISRIDSQGQSGYGCYFTVYALRKLVRMNADEVKSAIEVLNKSILEISSVTKTEKGNNTSDMSASFLPVKYLSKVAGSHSEQCWVIFHPAIMVAIDSLQYRPYLYSNASYHKKGLARYLHRRLIIRYTYASIDNTYNFNLRTLMNDFGKTPRYEPISFITLRNLARDTRLALLDLASSFVIMPNFTVESKVDDAGNINDYKYVVSATPEFTKQQKESNFLVSQSRERVKKISAD
jgi:hypothetical protein